MDGGRSGDDASNCAAKRLLIGFSVLIFCSVLVRVYALVTLWHCESP